MLDNTINILRLILGIPFLLFIPGYSLLLALIPKKGTGRTIETLSLSIVLSIALVPLLGLILNYTPWGITLETVLCSISVFVLTCLLIAWYRIRRLKFSDGNLQEQVVTPNTGKITFYGTGIKDFILTLVMIVVSVGVIFLLASFISAPKNQEVFTSFYIVEQNGNSGVDNIQLKAGEQGTVIVGIINQEGKDTTYSIGVYVDGTKDGEIGPIIVAWKQEWQGIINFTATDIQRQKIELKLYRNHETIPYLNPLYFWINVNN